MNLKYQRNCADEIKNFQARPSTFFDTQLNPGKSRKYSLKWDPLARSLEVDVLYHSHLEHACCGRAFGALCQDLVVNIYFIIKALTRLYLKLWQRMSAEYAQVDAIQCQEEDDQDLSEYEKQRLKTILKNDQLFSSLGLVDCVELVNKKTKKFKSSKQKKKRDKEHVRKSKRLTKVMDKDTYSKESSLDGGGMEVSEMPSLIPLTKSSGGKGFMTSPKGHRLVLSSGGGFSQTLRIQDVDTAGPEIDSSSSESSSESNEGESHSKRKHNGGMKKALGLKRSKLPVDVIICEMDEEELNVMANELADVIDNMSESNEVSPTTEIEGGFVSVSLQGSESNEVSPTTEIEGGFVSVSLQGAESDDLSLSIMAMIAPLMAVVLRACIEDRTPHDIVEYIIYEQQQAGRFSDVAVYNAVKKVMSEVPYRERPPTTINIKEAPDPAKYVLDQAFTDKFAENNFITGGLNPRTIRLYNEPVEGCVRRHYMLDAKGHIMQEMRPGICSGASKTRLLGWLVDLAIHLGIQEAEETIDVCNPWVGHTFIKIKTDFDKIYAALYCIYFKKDKKTTESAFGFINSSHIQQKDNQQLSEMYKLMDMISSLKYQTKVSDLMGRHGYSGVANKGERFTRVGGFYKFCLQKERHHIIRNSPCHGDLCVRFYRSKSDA